MTTMGEYRTFDDVVDGLAMLERRFRQQGDRRCVFLTLYSVISVAARERVIQGFFEDNEWVHRYAVAFANFYRLALERYEAGLMAAVPNAWRIAFDVACSGRGLVLQDLMLGVNAHVNNDLAFALSSIAIDPERDRRHRDHTAVNAVFAAVLERATERIAAAYAPGLRTLDDCAGQIDELVSLFSMEVARESAWEAAVALANARTDTERALTSRLISARAAVLGRLIRAPSLNPTFIAACSRLEHGGHWMALVSDAVAVH